jgi:hypothetical protein
VGYSNRKLKRVIKKSFFGIILLTIFVSCIILGFILSMPKPTASTALAYTPNDLAINAHSECKKYDKNKFRSNYDCYSDIFYKLTQKSGSDTAFKTAVELKDLDNDVKSSCHPIGHAIGWGVYDRDPANWKENIRKMSSECSYGAHMGMIERYASSNGGELDKNAVKSICDDSGGCNHGIGHVALVVTDNNIEKALDLCSVLPNNKEQRHWCYSGVFMERRTMQNLAEHIKVETERLNNWALYLDEFIEECKAYQGEVYIGCWTGLSLPASINFKGDPDKIYKLCNSATSREGANKCRREAVNYIIERKVNDLVSQDYLCDLGPSYDPDFARDCHNQIVHFGITNLKEKDFGLMISYCSKINNKYRSSCFSDIHNALHFIKVDPAKICNSAPSEYRKLCLDEHES